MAPVIRISKLTTRFGTSVIHQGLDLDVDSGDILAIVGGSGSGKTTLLRQMLGLEHPAAGTVEVFGSDVHHGDLAQQQRLRARWGMLFQHGALFSALTALDNVALPLREMRALPDDVIRDIALLKLAMVGIGSQDADKMPANLSGGMIKRVALARALAVEPELVFLDEPTAGLDPHMARSFVEVVRDLHRQLKLTVVMVTHDVETLLALATRVAVLADRRVIACDSPAAVRRLEHPFIQQFFQYAVTPLPGISENSEVPHGK